MKYTRPTTQTMATGEGRTYCFFPSCLNFTFFIHEKETQKRFDFILILKTIEYSLTSILVLLLRLSYVCHTVALTENSTRTCIVDDFKI